MSGKNYIGNSYDEGLFSYANNCPKINECLDCNLKLSFCELEVHKTCIHLVGSNFENFLGNKETKGNTEKE